MTRDGEGWGPPTVDIRGRIQYAKPWKTSAKNQHNTKCVFKFWQVFKRNIPLVSKPWIDDRQQRRVANVELLD